MLLDVHCHIDHYNNPIEVLEEAEKRGVFILAVTNLPRHFVEGLPHLSPYRNVRQAFGIHPLLADKHSSELLEFEKLLDQTTYVGEIGLDFSKNGRNTMDIQKKTLQIVLTKGGQDKVFSLHTRRAERQVLDMLLDARVIRAIFHWYSGPIKVLNTAIKAGYYFSVNPKMCRSRQGQNIISRIPLDRLLTETDGPFAGENAKPYYPWEVKKVIEYVAKIYSISAESIQKQIWTNFKRLVGGICKNEVPNL